MSDLTRLTIAEARDEMNKGALSSVDLTDAYMSSNRSRQRAQRLHDRDRLTRHATWPKPPTQPLAAGTVGALEGIPLGIKDLFGHRRRAHPGMQSHVLDGFKPRTSRPSRQSLWPMVR
jgi:aspartyl-tRNA(Asn)/glutamyl-tRNA(Gln) amidotransferase subunit A